MQTLADRLARRLVRTPDGCLVWTGATSHKGYGEIRVTGERSPVGTHRVAWALAHPGEPMPPVVRHSCDNPPCCEPSHLLGGTHSDNMRDAVARGRLVIPPGRRFRAGDDHPKTKVTDEQVAAMRQEYAAGGITQRELGARYGVAGCTVSLILSGRRRGA